MTRLIIWGAGTLGARVGARWASGPVVGFTASERWHAHLRDLGVVPMIGAPLAILARDDVLLLALPGHQAQHEAVMLLRDAGVPPPRRAVLIGSVGCYEPAGPQVDENTPVGTTRRARAIAAAEADFRAWAGPRGVVLRLGGLYGLERGPFHAFQRKRAIPHKPAHSTLSLIHYDDAATATLAALQRADVAPTYVCVTPPCPTRAEFYTAACARLGLPAPHFPDETGHLTNYDVRLLRRDLLPAPEYPDWHDSLRIDNCQLTIVNS
jgi:nucleoside-diphosphate-sugar epimerase